MRRRSVAEERPDIVAQWAPINKLTPDKVSCGSHLKVWWICEEGHKWEAVVKNRTLKGSGCPYCEHRAVLKGYNDLQTLFPEIAKTWSSKNQLKPSEVSSRSNAEILWICENGHEWKARVADRTDGHGCPYCAGQRVWAGFNDLATTHPDLIPEWSEKNKLTPDSITYKNRTNVWWHCSKCGNDYQAVVYARANGRVCPFCMAKEINRLRAIRFADRKIAKDFDYLLPQLAVIYYAGKHNLKVITDSEEPVGLPIAALVPEIGLAIDVCSSSKEISFKEYICTAHGIAYVCLPPSMSEEDIIVNVQKAFFDVHVYSNTPIEEDLERIRARYSQWKKRLS